MSIACPYCKTVLKPKELKPGKYNPKCPKCGSPFLLTVADDGSTLIQQMVQKTSGPSGVGLAAKGPAKTSAPLPDTVAVPMAPSNAGKAPPKPAAAPGDITDLDDETEAGESPQQQAPAQKRVPDTITVPVLKSDGTPAVPAPKPPSPPA